MLVCCGPVSSNIVCRMIADGRTYYLRCNHESERAGDDFATDMAFVENLAAGRAPRAIANRSPRHAGADIAGDVLCGAP